MAKVPPKFKVHSFSSFSLTINFIFHFAFRANYVKIISSWTSDLPFCLACSKLPGPPKGLLGPNWGQKPAWYLRLPTSPTNPRYPPAQHSNQQIDCCRTYHAEGRGMYWAILGKAGGSFMAPSITHGVGVAMQEDQLSQICWLWYHNVSGFGLFCIVEMTQQCFKSVKDFYQLIDSPFILDQIKSYNFIHSVLSIWYR